VHLSNLGDIRMDISEFMSELNYANDLPKNLIFSQIAPNLRKIGETLLTFVRFFERRDVDVRFDTK